MGKYLCTREEVEEALGDSMPEDANRNDVLDAVKKADERINSVIDGSDTGAIDDDLLARRANRAAVALAAHRVLMREAEMDPDVRLEKEAALDFIERVQNGTYAEPEEAEENESEGNEEE